MGADQRHCILTLVERVTGFLVIKKLKARNMAEATRAMTVAIRQLEARFDTNFPIRGLAIDKRFGHVVKMDRYKFVGRAWHGLQELPREQRYALYHAKKLKVAPPR